MRSPALISQQFCEVLFAPRFTDEALEVFAAKPNMRLLEDNERRRFDIAERDLKRVMGGLLVQDRDLDLEDRSEMEVVTERKPSEAEWGEMLFGWKVCKHVRSNAIVLSGGLASIGIGAGQMSRVDSVRLALEKARETGAELKGRRSPPTRSSPSPTARSWPSRPASGRSSSPAGPGATSRWWRRRTPPASRWSSRTGATSGTDAARAAGQASAGRSAASGAPS